MSRKIPALALVCAVLALSCGGDDDADPTATPIAPESTSAQWPAASITVDSGAASPTVVATATPEVLVEVAGPPEPLALAPDVAQAALVPELYVYNVELGAEVLRESETYFQAWLDVTPPFTYGEGQNVRLFDATSREWLRLDLSERVAQNVASDDGGRVIVTADGRTYLLDLVGKTQQLISAPGRPMVFSPDGSKLVFLAREQKGLSPFIVMPIADPEAAARLPLGASPNEIAQHSPLWLDDERLMLVSQKANLLQVFDVSRAVPQIVLEETIESDQVALSPDGRRLAVQEGSPVQAPNAVVVYELEPFGEVARFENASLGGQLAVPRSVWSADGARLLTSADTCLETERLVARDVLSGVETVVADNVPLMRFGFSPNAEWVAFTTFAKNGYAVSSDASSSPVLVSDDVIATVSPLWTSDSTTVAFIRFSGGYDRCLV